MTYTLQILLKFIYTVKEYPLQEYEITFIPLSVKRLGEKA